MIADPGPCPNQGNHQDAAPCIQVPPPPFVAFPKIPRLRRNAIITEKIDGTNAQIVVLEDGRVLAGSRNRWITPEQDNYGFARWVKEHEEELRTGLGVGQHFGEWWGLGIQRGYGLTEKRFSLFNVHRWNDKNPGRPACCGVVPLLAAGMLSDSLVNEALEKLRTGGSVAAPGFLRPEGIVTYFSASKSLHKTLLEGDELPKGAQDGVSK